MPSKFSVLSFVGLLLFIFKMLKDSLKPKALKAPGTAACSSRTAPQAKAASAPAAAASRPQAKPKAGDKYVALKDHGAAAPKWQKGDVLTVLELRANGYVRLQTSSGEAVGVLMDLWREQFRPAGAKPAAPAASAPAAVAVAASSRPQAKPKPGDKYVAVRGHGTTAPKWRKDDVLTVLELRANGYVRLQTSSGEAVGVLMDLWREQFRPAGAKPAAAA